MSCSTWAVRCGGMALTAALAGCSPSGGPDQATEVGGGEASILSLQIGDCIASDEIAEDAEFDVVPCSEAHRYVFYSAYPLFEADGITSQARAKARAEPLCRKQLAAVDEAKRLPSDAAIRTIVQYQDDGASRGSLLCFGSVR